MVSNNGLIIHCESNSSIFKTFEKMDKDGNISRGTGLKFGSVDLSKSEKLQKILDRMNIDVDTSKFKIPNAGKEQAAFYTEMERKALDNDIDAMKRYLAINDQTAEGAALRAEQLDRMTSAAKQEAQQYDFSADSIENYKKKTTASIKAKEVDLKTTKKLGGSIKNFAKNNAAMLGNIGAMAAISLAIQGASMLWEKANDYFKITDDKKLEAMETAVKKYNDRITETGENTKTLKSLQTEFNTLAKGVDDNGKNIGLSAEQYDRYNEIVAQLTDINPELVQGYTAEGNAILKSAHFFYFSQQIEKIAHTCILDYILEKIQNVLSLSSPRVPLSVLTLYPYLSNDLVNVFGVFPGIFNLYSALLIFSSSSQPF